MRIFTWLSLLVLSLGLSACVPAPVAPKPKAPTKKTPPPATGKKSESGSEASTTPDETKKPARIAVDQKAPEFQLKDQNGEEQSLAAMVKEQKVALVFYRSADW